MRQRSGQWDVASFWSARLNSHAWAAGSAWVVTTQRAPESMLCWRTRQVQRPQARCQWFNRVGRVVTQRANPIKAEKDSIHEDLFHFQGIQGIHVVVVSPCLVFAMPAAACPDTNGSEMELPMKTSGQPKHPGSWSDPEYRSNRPMSAALR